MPSTGFVTSTKGKEQIPLQVPIIAAISTGAFLVIASVLVCSGILLVCLIRLCRKKKIMKSDDSSQNNQHLHESLLQPGEFKENSDNPPIQIYIIPYILQESFAFTDSSKFAMNMCTNLHILNMPRKQSIKMMSM